MLKQMLTAAAVSSALVASVASPAFAAPVPQPSGAIVDIDRIVLHTGSTDDGGWANGWMEGSVTTMPAGFNQLVATLDVELTFGCVNRAGRSVRHFTQNKDFVAGWRAWNYDGAAGASWGPRLGLGEDFGMDPYPWSMMPTCPRGLTPHYLGSEVTSATVQYSHNGDEAPAIAVVGVFSYSPGRDCCSAE